MGRKASHDPLPDDAASRRSFDWRPREIFGLFKASAKEFVEDKSPKQAAALAYYTLFALGPLLVLAIGIASLVLGAEAPRAALLSQVGALLGQSGADGIAQLLEGAQRERVGLVGTIVGSIVLVVTAGLAFAHLKEAMDRVWEVQAKKAEGWKGKLVRAVRKNFLSFAGIMGTGFLLLVSLVMSTLLAALGDRLAAAFPGAAPTLQVVNALVALAVTSLVFAGMFKFLPDVRVAWRDVLVGAVVTAVLFLVGQFALGYYLGSGPLSTRYGAGGAVLVVLVWVYYSSMILFFGAEITQVYANRYGSRVRASDDAVTLQDAMTTRQSRPEREGTKREGRGGRRPQT